MGFGTAGVGSNVRTGADACGTDVDVWGVGVAETLAALVAPPQPVSSRARLVPTAARIRFTAGNAATLFGPRQRLSPPYPTPSAEWSRIPGYRRNLGVTRGHDGGGCEVRKEPIGRGRTRQYINRAWLRTARQPGSIPARRTTLDRTRTFWVGTMNEGWIERRTSTIVGRTA